MQYHSDHKLRLLNIPASVLCCALPLQYVLRLPLQYRTSNKPIKNEKNHTKQSENSITNFVEHTEKTENSIEVLLFSIWATLVLYIILSTKNLKKQSTDHVKSKRAHLKLPPAHYTKEGVYHSKDMYIQEPKNIVHFATYHKCTVLKWHLYLCVYANSFVHIWDI